MAATAEQIARLRRMVAEPTTTTYSDATLIQVIERHPLLDDLGREPYELDQEDELTINPDWVPTYDLNAAAADVWDEKAAALTTEFDFSAGGQNFSRSQAYAQAEQMARRYNSRRAMRTIRAWPAPRPDEDDDLSN